MNTELMFSSKTDLHATPQDFYDKLNEEFCFDYDPCATHENAKCRYYSTLEGTWLTSDDFRVQFDGADGLQYDWSRHRSVYMNPPYGDPEFVCKTICKKKVCAKRGFHNFVYKPGIVDWVKKACESDCPVKVALLPARTDTRWWHDYIQGIADEIRFIEGRLKFGDATNSAPFPSVVVVWRGAKNARPKR